ncbi:MAG: outer membrane lipid asymmetry maintenance protein MlaD [Gammaproteobacteria bacterium]|nr:outer membrane lipid asymmetry maintenance protein MlaD [Gammaproteobacteria bacterium]
MLQSKFIETVVGIFIAIGLAALLMLSMKVSNLSSLTSEDGYVIKARFLNIGGLKVRSPVKMAGVVIGRVSNIYIDEKSYDAVAELTIDEDFNNIPGDTSANIYTAGLLGEQYISLAPGGEETYLKEGDEIKITSDAVVLEQIIGQFLYSKAEGNSEGDL